MIKIEPDTLLHLYGFSNGIYIAAFLYLSFFTVSYYNKKNRKVSLYLLLSTITCALFGLYNIFTQQVNGAFTTYVIPTYLFSIGKFAAPIAMLLITFLYTNLLESQSFRAYAILKRHRYALLITFMLAVAAFIGLIFTESAQSALFIIHLAFFPTILIALYLTVVTYKHIRYQTILLSMLLISEANVAFVLIQIMQKKPLMPPEIFFLTNFGFGLIMMLYSFVSIRYSEHEAKRLFILESATDQEIALNIRKALSMNQLYMLYQPKQCLNTEKIEGLEALIRWHHPTLGNISPNQFIQIAEKTNTIDDICAWVIETVIRQASDFHKRKLYLPISINLSIHNLKPHIIDYLAEMLTQYQLPSSMIQIEITETVILDINNNVTEALEMIKNLNISLSMDDYGTGFSSLSYIKMLSLTELKIDKSFITNLEKELDSMIIVDSIIQMSKALNLSVTAEGVETESIKNILKDMGCDKIQGYLLTKPLSIPSLMQWMQQKRYL